MIFYWQSRDGAVASVDYSSAAAIAPHYPRKNSNSPVTVQPATAHVLRS